MSKVPYTTKLDEQIGELLGFYGHPKMLDKKDTQYTEEEVNDFFKNEYRQSLIDYAKENLPAAVIEGIINEEAKGLSGIGIYLGNNLIILYDAKGIRENIHRFAYEDPDEYNIEKYIVGIASTREREDHPHFTIEQIWAEKGYGPILYRLAIEQAGETGITPSIIKNQVSKSASRVWKEFYDGKGFSYVRHEPLDKKVHDVEWLDSVYYSAGESDSSADGVRTHEKIFEDDPYDELETNLVETADALLREKMKKAGYR
jgi:GNAT superfamily N-acetyltransferase